MGKNTFLSIPKKFRPLQKRHNCILTSSDQFIDQNISILNDLNKLKKWIIETNYDEYWIIGGEKLYKSILQEFYIDESSLKDWEIAKDAKSIPRVSKDGYEYNYSEGKMSFPDKLDRPSRTIVTGEGGKSVSRFKHVIQTDSGRYRRLMPLELERLNMFDDDWTVGAPDAKRAFFMGNALVVGIVEKLSNSLLKQANE